MADRLLGGVGGDPLGQPRGRWGQGARWDVTGWLGDRPLPSRSCGLTPPCPGPCWPSTPTPTIPRSRVAAAWPAGSTRARWPTWSSSTGARRAPRPRMPIRTPWPPPAPRRWPRRPRCSGWLVRAARLPDGESENDPTRGRLAEVVRRSPDAVVCPDPTALYFGGGYVNHRDHRVCGYAPSMRSRRPPPARSTSRPRAGPPGRSGTSLARWTRTPQSTSAPCSSASRRRSPAIAARWARSGSG